jgi:hypothetical protein
MNDPQFSPYDVPASKQPAKKHGCFFYGCITVLILAVMLGLLMYLGYRWVSSELEKWTSPTPEVFAKSQMSEEDRAALHKRWEEFAAALESQKPVEPLVLNSDQINAFIEDNADFKGKVHVEIKGDKIDGLVSIPIPNTGRYLNGEATLKVSLKDGVLIVTGDSISVKGKPLPDSFMQGFRTQNLAKDVYNNPKNAEVLRKIESIEVKDGTITVKARPKTEESDESKKAEGDVNVKVEPEPSKGEGKTESPPATPDQPKPESPPAPKAQD